jgi:hypothetical protein
MPVKMDKDKKGFYYRWKHQKKYYFKIENDKSMDIAHKKSIKASSNRYYNSYMRKM